MNFLLNFPFILLLILYQALYNITTAILYIHICAHMRHTRIRTQFALIYTYENSDVYSEFFIVTKSANRPVTICNQMSQCPGSRDELFVRKTKHNRSLLTLH